jgi:curli biogenesis system outer membrane secretion channel CsgG
MRKLFAVVTALLLSTAALAAQQPTQPPKMRVAVLDFDYATVKTDVAAIFGSDQDIGKGITALLIDKLVNDGNYRLVDRQQMAKILAEQNFSNSNRADPNSAAQIGKLLGVQAIIVGSITQFGRDDKNYGGSGGGGTWHGVGMGNLGLKKSKATVNITARIIDVNTGEILASSTGTGSSQRNGTSVGGSGSNWWSGGGGQLDMGSSNFGQTIIGEAVKGAVTTLGTALDADATKMPVAPPPPRMAVAGLVADVNGGELVLNVGAAQGVRVGDTLAITRTGRVIKDPATGKVLRSIDTPIGNVSITSVDTGSAVGNFSGAGTVKVGDKVMSPQ